MKTVLVTISGKRTTIDYSPSPVPRLLLVNENRVFELVSLGANVGLDDSNTKQFSVYIEKSVTWISTEVPT